MPRDSCRRCQRQKGNATRWSQRGRASRKAVSARRTGRPRRRDVVQGCGDVVSGRDGEKNTALSVPGECHRGVEINSALRVLTGMGIESRRLSPKRRLGRGGGDGLCAEKLVMCTAVHDAVLHSRCGVIFYRSKDGRPQR